MTKVLGVVGIDGSGKTSVIRRFVELSRAGRGFDRAIAMTCPRYHDTPDVPMSALSRQLDALSGSADALGSPHLKVAAMFLQMSLFGLVERFLIDAYEPAVLLSEHHAVIDSLAYGPLYGKLLRGAPDRDKLGAPLGARMAAIDPEALDGIDRWLRWEGRRLGQTLDLWALPEYALELLRLPQEALIERVARHYRTGLPDAVLVLDLPIEIAVARLSAREGQGEIHEQADLLEALRRQYLAVPQLLAREHPEVATFVVDTSAPGGVDAVLAQVVDRYTEEQR